MFPSGAVLTKTAGSERQKAAAPSSHSWHIVLLAETEPGRRNRRTIDSVSLLFAAIVIGLSAVVASFAVQQEQDGGAAVNTLLGCARAPWRTAVCCFVGLAVGP